jgi:ubiquinone biosynthesis monooxygenase Coq7
MHSTAIRTIAIGSRSVRTFSTASFKPSSAYTNPLQPRESATTTSPNDLTNGQQELLDTTLRVDQAGEVAANWIYRGQMAILGRHPTAGLIIQVCRSPLLRSLTHINA